MDYAQCYMKNGDKRTVGFIEERGAKVGNLVELPELDNELWEVTYVGHKMPKEMLREFQRGYKDFQGSTKGGGIDE